MAVSIVAKPVDSWNCEYGHNDRPGSMTCAGANANAETYGNPKKYCLASETSLFLISSGDVVEWASQLA